MELNIAIAILKEEMKYHLCIQKMLECVGKADECVEYRKTRVEAYETVLNEVEKNGLQ